LEEVTAYDDVHGGIYPLKLVKEARMEEITFMESRGIWSEVSESDCWEKTGKPPVSVRWVDTDKGLNGDIVVRSRLVARDFKGGDKDRDDLFAETPPLEAKRLLLSRAATRRKDGAWRKLLFVDARKAHLNHVFEEDVYIELPEECGAKKGICGKLNFWLYGFRPAAAAWEKHYSELLESVGFQRGYGCGVVFWHKQRDLGLAVHGDDFTFCGLDADLEWIKQQVSMWFDVKIRGKLGYGERDDKEVVILGRSMKNNWKRLPLMMTSMGGFTPSSWLKKLGWKRLRSWKAGGYGARLASPIAGRKLESRRYRLDGLTQTRG
jgi:hypothetical protein